MEEEFLEEKFWKRVSGREFMEDDFRMRILEELGSILYIKIGGNAALFFGAFFCQKIVWK